MFEISEARELICYRQRQRPNEAMNSKYDSYYSKLNVKTNEVKEGNSHQTKCNNGSLKQKRE